MLSAAAAYTVLVLHKQLAQSVAHISLLEESMDHGRFDQITRLVSSGLSRRTLAGVLGLSPLGLAGVAESKKNNKNKKKAKFNEFGCVDVGKFCKNAGQCCSGICEGKKDKKACQAHNEGTCVNGQVQDFCGGTDVACQTPSGEQGNCDTTTGKAGYCTGDGDCFNCRKDADCIVVCGASAACIRCTGCPETGGFACVGPEGNSCIDQM